MKIFSLLLVASALCLGGCRHSTIDPTTDLPTFVGKTYSEAKAAFGEPSESKVTEVAESGTQSATWGYDLGRHVFVHFDATTKLFVDAYLFIPITETTSDKEATLRECNVSQDDPRYAVKLWYKQLQDGSPSLITGVIIEVKSAP